MVIRFDEILGRESIKRERMYIYIYIYMYIYICVYTHIHTLAHTLKELTQTSRMHIFFGTWPTLQGREHEDMAMHFLCREVQTHMWPATHTYTHIHNLSHTTELLHILLG